MNLLLVLAGRNVLSDGSKVQGGLKSSLYALPAWLEASAIGWLKHRKSEWRLLR